MNRIRKCISELHIFLIAGGFDLKKEMLDERRFPKMHLDLQRLLQVLLFCSARIYRQYITEPRQVHWMQIKLPIQSSNLCHEIRSWDIEC